MKKIVIVLLSLLCVAGMGFANDFSKNGMLLNPGSVNANAGIGNSWGWGYNVGGGAEYIIGKFDVAQNVPFSYGVAARAALYFDHFDANPIGLGAFGTLHFNWGALKLPKDLKWLGNLDSYVGLGVDVLPDIWIDGIGGASYFFSKNFAVNLEAGFSNSRIGILYKF